MEVKPAAAVPAATKPASPFAAPPPAFAIAPNLVANAMQPANAARNTVPVFTFVMKGPLELKRRARALRHLNARWPLSASLSFAREGFEGFENGGGSSVAGEGQREREAVAVKNGRLYYNQGGGSFQKASPGMPLLIAQRITSESPPLHA